MKLITDPQTESTIGYISEGVILGFDKNNRPVEIGPVNDRDAIEVIKEWQSKNARARTRT